MVTSQWKTIFSLKATGLHEIIKSWWQGTWLTGRNRFGFLRKKLTFLGLDFRENVMSWPHDLITWSHLASSNNILLSPHPLTILSLPTSHLIFPLQNIALTKSAPACITSRHYIAIPISLFSHPKPYGNWITLQSLAI